MGLYTISLSSLTLQMDSYIMGVTHFLFIGKDSTHLHIQRGKPKTIHPSMTLHPNILPLKVRIGCLTLISNELARSRPNSPSK